MPEVASKESLADLQAYLEARVVGQSHAITKLCASVWRSELEFHDPTRPRGSFLFLGSTGVGKTELALALAERLCGGRDKISRFDMSEYMEKTAIERLVGKVDGFQGQLADAFEKFGENQVFLFDEMEKANPEILNIFLQILDAARFTVANGRILDFKKSFVIMTSNVGSSKTLSGRLLRSQVERSIHGELFSTFRPEFLNRFDDLIIFDHLSQEHVHGILKMRLAETLERFSKRGYRISVTEPVEDFILVDGYNKKLGARPLKRSIIKNLVDPLTLEITHGRLAPGSYVAQMELVDRLQRCVFIAGEIAQVAISQSR